jgi:hypothetical protein
VITYSILLDEKTLKLIADLDEQEVEVVGTITRKDDEEVLSIQECYRVFFGTLLISHDEAAKTSTVALQREGSRRLEITASAASRNLIEPLSGKKVRTTGTLTENKGKPVLNLRSCCEFVSAVGYVEAEYNDEDEPVSLTFSGVDGAGEEVEYDLLIDAVGRNIAENYTDEKVSITGFLVEKAGHQWLVPFTCINVYDDEEEEDEEEEETED